MKFKKSGKRLQKEKTEAETPAVGREEEQAAEEAAATEQIKEQTEEPETEGNTEESPEAAEEPKPAGRRTREVKYTEEDLAEYERKRKQKRKNRRTTLILVVIMLVGVGIMAYPTVSDWWNSFHQTRAIASYANTVENTSAEVMEAMLEDARRYNEKLASHETSFELNESQIAEYDSLLDLSGNGVMGYISINVIGVNLPIYHGTKESVLQRAIGHLDWTSLPVGGESTHCAMSGHRGLPSAKLFTDLDKLVVGDTFTLTILNQMSTYQVDQIRIVLPYELDDLVITKGEDYCTLITCTPYGINTHRLLVRGHRIENAAGEVVVTAGGIRIPNYIAIPAVGIPLLFLFLVGIMIYDSVRYRNTTEAEMERYIREEKAKAKKKSKGGSADEDK